MAIVHADNFSIYGTDTGLMLNGVYAEITDCSLGADIDGVSAGRVLYINGNNSNSTDGFRYILPGGRSKVGICGRVWLYALPTGNGAIPLPMQWRNSGNAALVTVTIETTGVIAARTGGQTGAIFAQSSVPVVTATGWFHYEAVYDASNGDFELRIESTPVITAPALGPVNGANSIAQLYVGTRSSNTGAVYSYVFKDFVVWDSTGSSNNNFLGSVLVGQLLTTSDVALNWTPSSGTTGWNILDNIPPVDATYLAAPYNPAGPPFYPSPYKAVMSNLPLEATSVKALISYVRAAKIDGGDGQLQVGIISDPSGTPATALGANRPITIAQTYWRDVFEVDPKTSAAWLPAAVNDINIQINRTL